MKEWYLIGQQTAPNMIGGYEDQGFVECKDDAFIESLTTSIADTVILYNYDLSKSKQIRVILQGNTADTYLKSMERSIMVSIGTLHAGDYIYFEDSYWIVEGRPGNNKIYEKATLKLCQYKLRWQRDDGKIIERWANLTSASKYDIGESGNNVIVLGNNNFTVVMPHDKDSMTIEGKRVFIDTSETPRKVFKITRNDDALFIYRNQGAVLSLIADKTEFNPEVDRPDLLLCDYIDVECPSLDHQDQNIIANISGDPTIKLGFSRIFTVNFMDENSNELSWQDINFRWNIVSSFDLGLIEQTVQDNRIKLLIEDELCLDEKFKLQVLTDDTVIGEIVITVLDIF